MSVKVPECILTGMNECVKVDSPARSDNQETLLSTKGLAIDVCKLQGTPNNL